MWPAIVPHPASSPDAMAKAMSIFGMVVAGLLLLAFALDAVVWVPFGGLSPLMDIVFALCALAVGYMSWDALRSVS